MRFVSWCGDAKSDLRERRERSAIAIANMAPLDSLPSQLMLVALELVHFSSQLSNFARKKFYPCLVSASALLSSMLSEVEAERAYWLARRQCAY